jgi:hypothetical protein
MLSRYCLCVPLLRKQVYCLYNRIRNPKIKSGSHQSILTKVGVLLACAHKPSFYDTEVANPTSHYWIAEICTHVCVCVCMCVYILPSFLLSSSRPLSPSLPAPLCLCVWCLGMEPRTF